ncbi:SMC family ATPase [Nocardiopsis sp. ATB16-24]|uniref:AAA family ATPase n=1 Tax=Nocardiopsis sp. ATB16-24 TaxID=3019555 RepID=UPI002553506C|nr:SMC family ATPase [Nocardiopsis sp. ATB16-24]
MRLHTLTIEAFGPFAGTEKVDFDRLSAGGLFLIHGPTGAGKTSVLDAVCFALYGNVPGARGKDRSPKSDHAPLDRLPRITLEFTVRGRRVRIERSPRWERPKKRGAGTRVENAKVLVQERVDGRWEGVTNRPDEAGQFVGDLVGLTLEQFCQTAMLPQGDFARFLRARSDERRDSLERIFNTRVFRDVEEWFKEHTNRLRHEVEASDEEVRAIAARIAEVGRSTAPEPPEELLSAWAAELALVTSATARDAESVTAGFTEARESAQRALAEARDLRDRQERLASARRHRARLAEHTAWRAEIDVKLEAAERAETVLPFLRARDSRRTEADKCELAVAERLSLVGDITGIDTAALSPTGTTDRAPQEVLREAERERRDELARLDLLRGEAERCRTLGRSVTALTARLADLRGQLERRRALAAELPLRLERLTEELREVRERAARTESAEAALAAALRRRDAVTEHERLSRELETAEGLWRTAVDEAQAARERALRLRERRNTHMAAELAAGLVPGEACAVCGSMEHPLPARPSGQGLVSAEEEEGAREAAEAATARRTEAESAVAALREKLSAAHERAEGHTADTAREEVETRGDALARARAAAEEALRLEEALTQAAEELERARSREEELSRQEIQVRADLDNSVREHGRLTALLDQARGDDAGLNERITRLHGEADLLRAAADAVDDRDRALEELGTATGEAQRSREEAGFVDEAAVWEVALDERRRRSLRERARSFDAELAAAEAAMSDPALVAAAELPAPDLEGAASTARRAAEAADQAVSRQSMLLERARRLTALRAELGECLAGREPVLRRYAVARGLRDLTTGLSSDNTDNVRLSAYVLASRLEQVVAAANDRLVTMSDGRYELRYTVDKAAGDGRARSAGGLGMRVVDAWTGVERDPATLSGGETFFSSLALALGLGDVAGAEAGGADIDTLFVDEGFGTLDEDTLEEVLEVLDRLRDGGRAVGVVSHVADLRQRVPTQLKVVKGAAGSHVRHVG